ncbi:hypothetical protein DFJ74DRAFT_79270 [Hyaloraphidium curvatum]|nr:hypothetical protein DFJ74DRAFT_79270 [Hyaloraphidium curvatum]
MQAVGRNLGGVRARHQARSEHVPFPSPERDRSAGGKQIEIVGGVVVSRLVDRSIIRRDGAALLQVGTVRAEGPWRLPFQAEAPTIPASLRLWPPYCCSRRRLRSHNLQIWQPNTPGMFDGCQLIFVASGVDRQLLWHEPAHATGGTRSTTRSIRMHRGGIRRAPIRVVVSGETVMTGEPLARNWSRGCTAERVASVRLRMKGGLNGFPKLLGTAPVPRFRDRGGGRLARGLCATAGGPHVTRGC